MMRTLVHTYPGVAGDPAAMLRRLHDHFHFLEGTAVYATAIYAVVDRDGRSLSVASAGHPPPLLFRAGSNVCAMDCETTTPLLLREPGEVSPSEIELRRGDRVLFYTDGVTDRESPAGEPYDMARLCRALGLAGSAPADRALASIVADIDAFAGDAESGDDNTLLMMEVR
jgi:sigma-B regulation protein RsbU (phosphoserine phosphatase)